MHSSRRAFTDGLRRVAAAPALLVSMWAVTLLLAVPLGLTIRTSIDAHLGSSLEADRAADAVNYDWWSEFTAQAPGLAAGLATTFSPSIIGFASTLDNISSVLDGQAEIRPIVWILAGYLALWTFLLGGTINRYARQRPTRAHGFFAASGVFFFRFLRLAIVAGVAYWFLFQYVHEWLFDKWYVNATRDLDTERVAFVWRLGMYVIFGVLLLVTNAVMDYARIRAVVEDRRSMLGAVLAAIRFCWRHKAGVAALYAMDALLFLGVIAVWALVAPEAGPAGFAMWARFLVAQVYVIARLFTKLQFIASQTSLFQASLAHARYTAVPEPQWPESPAAEAIIRA